MWVFVIQNLFLSLLLNTSLTVGVPDDPPNSDVKTVIGKITTFQKESKQFVIKASDSREVILSLNDNTTVRVSGEIVNWSDLKEGMTVAVSYSATTKPPQYLAASIIAERGEIPNEAEPIIIKGKINWVKEDLSEIKIKTVSDTLVTIQVGEDWRNRLKNNTASVTSLDKGTEVTAVYILRNGKNQLVVLRDLIGKPDMTASQPNVVNKNVTNNTINSQQINNQQLSVMNSVPLIASPLPLGFMALSNQASGMLQAEIVQIKTDAAYLATGISSSPPQAGATSNQTAVQPSSQAGQTKPLGTPSSPESIVNRDYLVLLLPNSKEPMLVDQQTTITIGSRRVGLQDLAEGTSLRFTFETLRDGAKHVTSIIATEAQTTRRDPFQPNSGSGQSQTARSGGLSDIGSANELNAVVVRRKQDAIFVQGNQKELMIFMTVNSIEPLRMDDRTCIVVNNQVARFQDLQVRMNAQVYLEVFNQLRRVIGVVASNSPIVLPKNTEK